MRRQNLRLPHEGKIVSFSISSSGIKLGFFLLAVIFSLASVSGQARAIENGQANPNNSNGPALQDQKKESKMNLEALENSLLSNKEGDDFVYKREGRPDPFVPFITQEMLQAATKGAEEELTGMRKFEPGQLTLVAIVFTEKGPLAMVQDSTGKGYTIRKGTKIGRTGEVVNIVSNKVIINEVSYTLSQKKRYKSVEMVLKKEGEKK